MSLNKKAVKEVLKFWLFIFTVLALVYGVIWLGANVHVGYFSLLFMMLIIPVSYVLYGIESSKGK